MSLQADGTRIPVANGCGGRSLRTKKRVRYKDDQNKPPKVLWDDCLEVEAYIRSNTDLDIFKQDRMTPETKM